MNRELVIIFVLVIIAFGVFFFLIQQKPSENYDEFARCLTEKGATMYGAVWCGHCQDQKKIFGNSFKYINYVECPENQELCRQKGIDGYPTWIINDKKYPGFQNFEKLSQLSGCKI